MNTSLESNSRTLLNGTIIYFIGNVLTQLISILLLRYVTGAVTAEEYGYFNLVVTIDNLVTPMITLQISDAVFRFFIKTKSEEDKRYIYSSGTAIIVAGISLLCVLLALLRNKIGIEYPIWVALYVISTNIFGYNQKVVRSLKQNRLYVIGNLMKSAIYFVFMVLFVLHFRMGIKGLLMANCLSTYICVIFLEIKVKTLSYFSIDKVRHNWIRDMIKFSAPLIPNTAVWWMQSSINSVIITMQIGLGYNGIYSVSVKFASIMNLVITVFNLAWQESAITEYGNPGYKSFASSTLNRYIQFLLSAVAVLIPLLRLIIPWLIDEGYYEAIPYIPFLLFATSLSACSGYFAQMITAKNQNIKLLKTNLIGAISNIFIVLLLVRVINIWAVVISAVMSNILLSGCRFYEIKEDLYLNEIQWKKHIALLLLCVSQCAVYLINHYIITFLSLGIVFIICLCVNWAFIKEIVIILQEKILKGQTR